MGDIEGAFNHVQHQHVPNKIRERVDCNRTVTLINHMLKSKIMEVDGRTDIPFEGRPQGSILSPLLWNIAFMDFDKFMDKLQKDLAKQNTKTGRIPRNTPCQEYSRFRLKILKAKKGLKGKKKKKKKKKK